MRVILILFLSIISINAHSGQWTGYWCVESASDFGTCGYYNNDPSIPIRYERNQNGQPIWLRWVGR